MNYFFEGLADEAQARGARTARSKKPPGRAAISAREVRRFNIWPLMFGQCFAPAAVCGNQTGW